VSTYELGAGQVEQERLRRQGQALAPHTRLLFQAAGIGPGMRVLDLGSGMGDVALLVAELVGADGAVVGIDRSEVAVGQATRRAREAGRVNVAFHVGDINTPAPAGPFDAIVGRLVLMYAPDPAAVLRTQAAQLRSGGVVAPVELDIPRAAAAPATPLVDRSLSWIREAFGRAGIHIDLGPRLWAVLEEAGLRPQGMLAVQPYFGPEDPDGPAMLAGIVGAVLPIIERTGVASAEEVEPDTLHRRMGEELASAGAVLAHPPLVSAWGRAA
jgi:ubiquinone/menaquinone biosynthesis C-methylase UbiE